VLTIALLSAVAVAEPVIAEAAAPEKPKGPWMWAPWVRPTGGGQAIWVNGRPTAQLQVGVTGGLQGQYRPVPHWRVNFGGSLVGLYGMAANSLGVDARIGATAGPNSKYVLYQVGPQLWFNTYGKPGALDYYLPPALGVALPNTVLFKVHEFVGIQLGAIPSWIIWTPTDLPSWGSRDYRRNRVWYGPVNELSLYGTVNLKLPWGGAGIQVGYQRSWTAIGVTDGLILGGSLF
jgi:hypothetical protein